MKVAIVHPMFLEEGGGELVADVLAEMYPDADIFTLSADRAILPPHIRNRKLFTSVLDKALLRWSFIRNFSFPLYPWAVERLDLSGYDLVISSCPPVMGVNVDQHAVHICYCHTPSHSWWGSYAEYQAKLHGLQKNVYVMAAIFYRMWEFSAMQRIDHIVVNSKYVSRRVWRYFRRRSTVIYPPVNTQRGYLEDGHDDYYLTVSRLTTRKRIDLLIRACNELQRPLVVVGSGNKEKELKAIAGPTIKFSGRLPDEELRRIYARCRAFLFAADEDFGMATVEAQAFGRPVIAYGYGGTLETVRGGDAAGDSDTGVYFSEQTVESVVDGILRFEANEHRFISAEIQQHARQFDRSFFVRRMREFVDESMSKERASISRD